MNFPGDRCMLSLASLDHASGGKYTLDGRTFARVQITDGDPPHLWEILDPEMDELERQGWVEFLPPAPDDPDAAKVQVTDKGRYALTKWVRKNYRRLPQLIRDAAFLLMETRPC